MPPLRFRSSSTAFIRWLMCFVCSAFCDSNSCITFCICAVSPRFERRSLTLWESDSICCACRSFCSCSMAESSSWLMLPVCKLASAIVARSSSKERHRSAMFCSRAARSASLSASLSSNASVTFFCKASICACNSSMLIWLDIFCNSNSVMIFSELLSMVLRSCRTPSASSALLWSLATFCAASSARIPSVFKLLKSAATPSWMPATLCAKASKPWSCDCFCATSCDVNSSYLDRSCASASRKLWRPPQTSSTPSLVEALCSSSCVRKLSGLNSFMRLSLSSAMLCVKRSMPSLWAAFCASISLATASVCSRSARKASRRPSRSFQISLMPSATAFFCSLASARILSSCAETSAKLLRNCSTMSLNSAMPCCWLSTLRWRSSCIAFASTSARSTSMLCWSATMARSWPDHCDSNFANKACPWEASSTICPRKESTAFHILSRSSSFDRRYSDSSSATPESRLELSSMRVRSSSTAVISVRCASP
mmetsp:Transcript_67256/g.194486  ORF Transcript_67256/g.194486 Transcript_67256/m.194486 type:complete len:484 (+) Transcript_67256:235-1686(+)